MELVDSLDLGIGPCGLGSNAQLLSRALGTGQVQAHGVRAGCDQCPGLVDVELGNAGGRAVSIGIVGLGPDDQIGSGCGLVEAAYQSSSAADNVGSQMIAPAIVGDGHILGIGGDGDLGVIQNFAVNIDVLALFLGVILSAADHSGPEVAGEGSVVLGGLDGLSHVEAEAVDADVNALLQEVQDVVLHILVGSIQVGQTGQAVLGHVLSAVPAGDVGLDVVPVFVLAQVLGDLVGKIVAGLVAQVVCDHVHDDLDTILVGSCDHAFKLGLGAQRVAILIVDLEIDGLVVDPPVGANRGINRIFLHDLNGRSLDGGVALCGDGRHVGFDLSEGPVPAVQGHTVLDAAGILNAGARCLIAQGNGVVIVLRHGDDDFRTAGDQQLVPLVGGKRMLCGVIHGRGGDCTLIAVGHVGLGIVTVHNVDIAVCVEGDRYLAVCIELVVAANIVCAVDVANQEVLIAGTQVGGTIGVGADLILALVILIGAVVAGTVDAGLDVHGLLAGVIVEDHALDAGIGCGQGDGVDLLVVVVGLHIGHFGAGPCAEQVSLAAVGPCVGVDLLPALVVGEVEGLFSGSAQRLIPILALIGLGQDHGGDTSHADAAGSSTQRFRTSLGAVDVDGPLAVGQSHGLGGSIGIEDDEDIGGLALSLCTIAVHAVGEQLGGHFLAGNIGSHFCGSAVAQRRMGSTEGDQALVVLGICLVGGIVQVGPLQVVDIVRGIVAVLDTGTALGELLTEEFLTGMDEGNTLGSHVVGSCQVVHLDDGAVDRALTGRLDDLVHQGVVIVAGCVLDDLLGVGGPPGLCQPVGRDGSAVACAGSEAGGAAVVAADVVTHGVGEVGKAGGLGRVALLGHLGALFLVGAVHIPAFAVEDDVGTDCMDFGHDLVDGLHIQQAHQVEAEAVDVVLLAPVQDGFDDVLADHLTLGSGVVAAAGGVGIHTGEVAGNDVVEAEGIGVVNMVVDHVHDDADIMVMQGLDHLLELLHTDRAVVGIGGVGAFGGVVVLRIVAPVEGLAGGLVHGGIVIDGQQVDMSHAQIVQIVDAGGGAVGSRGAGLGEGQVLAAFRRTDAGAVVNGEVTDVQLVDDGIGIRGQGVGVGVRSPASRIGGIQIDDHAAVAVDTGGAGIGVNCFHFFVTEGDGIGVVGAVQVAINSHIPDALLALGHGNGVLQVIGASGAGLIQLHGNFGSSGCPDLEGGAVAGPGRAQIVAVVGILVGELVSSVDIVDADVVSVAAVRDLVLRQGSQIQLLVQGQGVGIAGGLYGRDGDVIVIVLGVADAQLSLRSAQSLHGGHDDRALRIVILHIGDLVGSNDIGAGDHAVGHIASIAVLAIGDDIDIDRTGNDIVQGNAHLGLFTQPVLAGGAHAGLEVDILGGTAFHGDGGDHLVLISVAVLVARISCEVIAGAADAVAPDVSVPSSGLRTVGIRLGIDIIRSVVVDVDVNGVGVHSVGIHDGEHAVAIAVGLAVGGVSGPGLAIDNELVLINSGSQVLNGSGPDALVVLGHGNAAGPGSASDGTADLDRSGAAVHIFKGDGGAVDSGAYGQDNVRQLLFLDLLDLILAVGISSGVQLEPDFRGVGRGVEIGSIQLQVDRLAAAVAEDVVQALVGGTLPGNGRGVVAVVVLLGNGRAGPGAGSRAVIVPDVQVQGAPCNGVVGKVEDGGVGGLFGVIVIVVLICRRITQGQGTVTVLHQSEGVFNVFCDEHLFALTLCQSNGFICTILLSQIPVAGTILDYNIAVRCELYGYFAVHKLVIFTGIVRAVDIANQIVVGRGIAAFTAASGGSNFSVDSAGGAVKGNGNGTAGSLNSYGFITLSAAPCHIPTVVRDDLIFISACTNVLKGLLIQSALTVLGHIIGSGGVVPVFATETGCTRNRIGDHGDLIRPCTIAPVCDSVAHPANSQRARIVPCTGFCHSSLAGVISVEGNAGCVHRNGNLIDAVSIHIGHLLHLAVNFCAEPGTILCPNTGVQVDGGSRGCDFRPLGVEGQIRSDQGAKVVSSGQFFIGIPTIKSIAILCGISGFGNRTAFFHSLGIHSGSAIRIEANLIFLCGSSDGSTDRLGACVKGDGHSAASFGHGNVIII